MRQMYDGKTHERECWCPKAACRQVGWGKVTCDNVEAVGGVQDLLQPDHVGVLRQHTHDSHLLHGILYDMLGRFPHLVLHSAGWRYTAHA